MPVPNKTHNLVSQYQTFLLLCILQVREERKKRQRCHTVLICTEKDRGNESRKAPLAACYHELPEVWTRKWKKLFSGASSSCRDYGDHCWLLFSCPVMSDSFQLHGLWHMCLSVHGIQYLGHEYWNGLPFPSPGILPHPGIELRYPALAGKFFTAMSQGKLKVKVSQENYNWKSE